MYAEAGTLECRRLTEEWKEPLLDFLNDLSAGNDALNFHPHPFTSEAVELILRNVRSDLYYVMTEKNVVLGYGLLRGWDEGFEIPSLGIAIHPRARGIGLGKMFMYFLSASAKRKGARKIRLRVRRDNTLAHKFYENLGYKFESQEHEYLVGFLNLDGMEKTGSVLDTESKD